jgi:AbrB family looped-hinge helix DNA binding protein
MPSTRLSTKGQIVLPQEIRASLNWTAGTELQVDREGDVVILRARPVFPKKDLHARDAVGVLKWNGPTVSIREMDQAIDDMFRREWKA